MKQEELEQAFVELSGKVHDGVKGVEIFDSGSSGPVVGVTVQTHGNEPVGLAAYRFFKDKFELNSHLVKGKVIFVLNNIEGSRLYFEAKKNGVIGADDVGRFVDVNMNRLPDDLVTISEDNRYEVNRAKELIPIWKQFEYAIDIHSTSLASIPMIVALTRSNFDLMKKFPFEYVLSNIENIQIGTPAAGFYGNENTSVFGLEAGQHTHPDSFHKAVVSVESLLSLLGMIESDEAYQDVPKTEYMVTDSMLYPDDSYRMAATFETFEPIQKGRILMVSNNGGPDVICPFDCYSIFARDVDAKIHKGEEAIFLTLKK